MFFRRLSAIVTKTIQVAIIACLTCVPLLVPSVYVPPLASAASSKCESSWQVVYSPYTGQNTMLFYGMAAVSPNNIWAVGRSGDDTLIAHWDGSDWSAVPSPNGADYNYLHQATANSAQDIWAVGDYYDSAASVFKTLIEHWNGVNWSIVPSPNPANAASGTNKLEDVAAVSTKNVWVVGSSGLGNNLRQTLVERWNGTQWKIVASPNIANRDSFLNGIDLLNASDGWAVGRYTFSDNLNLNHARTLIEHWDGSSWQITPSPNPTSGDATLYKVQAISANDAWAVGSQNKESPSYKSPLLLHWDGTQWQSVPSPAVSAYNAELLNVTARAWNDVWAVGYYDLDSAGFEVLLTEHWDGIKWSVVPISQETGTLQDIAAFDAKNAWAVGIKSSLPDMPLAARYTGFAGRPVLQQPKNGSTLAERRVSLQWEATNCAEHYEVVVHKGKIGGEIVDTQTNLTSPKYKTKPLARGSRYVWQVSACNVYGCGWRSVPGKFKISQ